MPDPSVAEHLDRILALVAPVPEATVTIGGALGAVTAEDVTAAIALPRFDHAAMDGYAVRAVDVAGASAAAPVSLPVCGVIAAGAAWPGPLEPGTALRIMTGAAVPEGAPSLREATSLTVEGDWTFGPGVAIKGDVSLDRPASAQRIPADAVLGADD